MRKILILSLPIIVLSGCSLLGNKTTDPITLTQNLATEEKGTYTTDCIINWFYTDIDKRVTSEKKCYRADFKIFPNIAFSFDAFNKELMKEIVPLRKYLEKNGFKKNSDNIADISLLSDWSRYYEGYENGNTKCSIVGYTDGYYQNRNYISLMVSCSDKLNDQKALQKKLLETVNGGDYPYTPYKDYGWIYIDRTSGDFLHGSSAGWFPGGTEVMFMRNGDNFKLIYEGNSGIPCSVVQQYNIPSYIYGECD